MANAVSRYDSGLARMDDLFDSFFPRFFGNDTFQVDIKESDAEYELTADLPGFKKEELNVTYDHDVLTIAAERNNVVEDKDEEGHFVRRERSSQSYHRQFMLKGIDESAIAAEFKDGVLTMQLPKRADAKEPLKKIEIK